MTEALSGGDTARLPILLLWLVGGIFGLALVFLVPPMDSGDGPTHWKRAFAFSEGQFEREVQRGRAGFVLPVGIRSFQFAVVSGWKDGFARGRRTFSEAQLNRIKLGERRIFFPELGEPQQYGAVLYAPFVLGIAAARPFTDSVLSVYRAGRISALLFWLLCGTFALRLLPVGRWVLLVALLIPGALLSTTSYGVDLTAAGATVLWIAAVLRFAQGPPLQIGLLRGAGLLALAAILGMAKVVYAPFLALVLLLPKQCFSGVRRRRLFLACLPLVALGAAGLGRWAGDQSLGASLAMTPGSDVVVMLESFLEHPERFFSAMRETLVLRWRHMAFGMLGLFRRLGEPMLPFAYPLAGVAMALALLAGERRSVSLPRGFRGITFLAAGLSVLLIFFAAWLLWSGDSLIIRGVQGRYFLPILPAVLLALHPSWLVLPGPFPVIVRSLAIVMSILSLGRVVQTLVVVQGL